MTEKSHKAAKSEGGDKPVTFGRDIDPKVRAQNPSFTNPAKLKSAISGIGGLSAKLTMLNDTDGPFGKSSKKPDVDFSAGKVEALMGEEEVTPVADADAVGNDAAPVMPDLDDIEFLDVADAVADTVAVDDAPTIPELDEIEFTDIDDIEVVVATAAPKIPELDEIEFPEMADEVSDTAAADDAPHIPDLDDIEFIDMNDAAADVVAVDDTPAIPELDDIEFTDMDDTEMAPATAAPAIPGLNDIEFLDMADAVDMLDAQDDMLIDEDAVIVSDIESFGQVADEYLPLKDVDVANEDALDGPSMADTDQQEHEDHLGAFLKEMGDLGVLRDSSMEDDLDEDPSLHGATDGSEDAEGDKGKPETLFSALFTPISNDQNDDLTDKGVLDTGHGGPEEDGISVDFGEFEDLDELFFEEERSEDDDAGTSDIDDLLSDETSFGQDQRDTGAQDVDSDLPTLTMFGDNSGLGDGSPFGEDGFSNRSETAITEEDDVMPGTNDDDAMNADDFDLDDLLGDDKASDQSHDLLDADLEEDFPQQDAGETSGSREAEDIFGDDDEDDIVNDVAAAVISDEVEEHGDEMTEEEPARKKSKALIFAVAGFVAFLTVGAGIGAYSSGMFGGGSAPAQQVAISFDQDLEPVDLTVQPGVDGTAQPGVAISVTATLADPIEADLEADEGSFRLTDLLENDAPVDAISNDDGVDAAATPDTVDLAGSEDPSVMPEADGDLIDLATAIDDAETTDLDAAGTFDPISDLAAQIDGLNADGIDAGFSDDVAETASRPEDMDRIAYLEGVVAENAKNMEELTSTVAQLNNLLMQALERDSVITARVESNERSLRNVSAILGEFSGFKQSLDQTQIVLLDVAARVGDIERNDPADRDEVNAALRDIDGEIKRMSANMAILGRMTIEGVTALQAPNASAAALIGVQTSQAPMPREQNDTVYTTAETDDVAFEGTTLNASSVPRDATEGDFIDGFGYVLEVVSADGNQNLVIMENGSVLVNR